ncbi:ribosomal protein L11 methyltransferase [Aureimonas endophytica]|uniref:Ribosomal protein L11 methyltransferase n=1 Tax=Aureimonas endophytica TaxID=2027858 RepID=A0A916ZPN8_9HYPH|nr:50S ribosomal protein L11 methyltransferase [Aureimonas endophytica]GGE07928.1 ribosomal protein L11 methyltransferase [Aureimonas endophytica]
MTDRPVDAAAFIEAHLPVVAVPGIPEVRLHRASPASGLNRLAARDAAGFGSPYWAYPWAGGLALARHLLDHPQIAAGRRVLDLGAGSGLVAIAAAKAGAREVLAAEIDPYARAALALNARLNGVEIAVTAEDLLSGEPPAVDLVLAGDLFYAPDLAARVLAFLERAARGGAAVLIGDPWRAALPLARLRLLARYETAEVGRAAPVPSGVFTLAP